MSFIGSYNPHLLDGVQHVHFIGCGGSGTYPLIQILHSRGYAITGSDVEETKNTEAERALGVRVCIGHDAANVGNADLVVYSAAIHDDNPELQAARARGIKAVERSVMLGYISRTHAQSIGVAGTHGKTTTTGMITTMLELAGRDPAAVIGGKLPLIGGYGKAGSGQSVVIEACEYHETFLHLTCAVGVILNIDNDHLEYYGTMGKLKLAFQKFALLSRTVVFNMDDKNTMDVVNSIDRPVLSFGIEEEARFRAVNIGEYKPGFFEFDVLELGEHFAHIKLGVPGYHNIYNALAMCCCVRPLGLKPEDAVRAAEQFHGTGRRFEIKGECNGAVIVDDYAHHPTEIAALLDAARRRYPDSTIRVIFQPHLFSRTKFFAHQFAKSLAKADDVIITGIFPAREKQADFPDISPSTIVDAAAGLKDASAGTWIQPVEDMCLAAKMMAMRAHHGDVIFTVGAGDITDMDQVLLTALEAHRESCE